MPWLRRLGLVLLVALPVLVGLGLWFGPRFTDWNEHRDQLAILAAGRLGQPVTLTGPVQLTLLPQPMLEAGGVTIGGPAGGSAGALSIQARALRLRLDLGALLRFRLEPREVVLVGAEIRLPWPPTSGQPFRPPPWLTELRGRIEDSRITIGSVALERVTADLAAGSATDALRIAGQFRWRNLDATFQTTLGRPGWDDAAPMDLTVSAANASLSTSGVLLPLGGFEGNLQGGGSDLSVLVPGPPGSFRVRGRLSATADLLTADQLELDIAGSPARGAATLRLAPAPRLDVALLTGRVALDPWIAALRGAAAPALPFGLDLSAEAASFRGITLRRLRGAAFLEGERLTLSDVSAILPGDTQIDMSGATSGRLSASGKLEAAIRFRGTALRATLQALGLNLDGADPDRLRQGDGRLRLVLEESQVAVPEFTAMIDGARVSGAGVLRFGPRPALGLGLNFDRLALDGWLPAQTDLFGLATRPGTWDANLRLAANHATWRDLSVEKLAVDAALEGGRLTVRRLAGQVAGGDLALSGTLFPAVAATGTTPATAPRLADVALDVTAPVARPLLALLPGGFGTTMPAAAQPLALRLAASGPLNALVLRGGGDLGESRMEASGTLDSLARRYTGTLTLRHPGAPRMVNELFGVAAPNWLGEGSFALIASLAATQRGAQLDSFDLVAGDLRASGQLGLATAAGSRPRLTGRIQADRLPLPPLADPAEPVSPDWLKALDADIAWTATQVLPAAFPALEQANGSLKLNGGIVQLDPFQAMLNGGRLDGAITLDTSVAPPVLSAQAKLGSIGISGTLAGLPVDLTAGQLEGEVTLSAAGHSRNAMLATLEGSANLGVGGGVLTGADLPAAFQAAAQPGTAPGAEAALRQALLNGATAFDRLTVGIRLQAGRAVVTQADMMLNERLQAALRGEVDLARGGVDLSLDMQPPEGPEFGLRLTGPLRQPARVPDIADWLRWHAERP
jgi:uncharacterized protein involved in outer membrane biogenesis